MAAPLRQKHGFVLLNFQIKDKFLKQFGIESHQKVCNRCVRLRGNVNRTLYIGTRVNKDISTANSNNYWCDQLKGGNWKTRFGLPKRCLPLIDCFSEAKFSYLAPLLVNQKRFYTHEENGRKKCSVASGTNDDVKERKTENIYTIPNFLTLSRVMLTPVIGMLVVQQSFPLALGLFTFAGITDWLDGYIARNFKNQMSTFGTAMDPLADKILVTVLTITLTMANLLPVPLAVVIIGRDTLLVISGFVIRYVSLPPPFTIRRYFDGTIPTVKLSPSSLSKFNTSLQLSLVCLTLAAPVFDFVDHPVLKCLWVLTAATTLGSGIDYVINRTKYVKYLKER